MADLKRGDRVYVTGAVVDERSDLVHRGDRVPVTFDDHEGSRMRATLVAPSHVIPAAVVERAFEALRERVDNDATWDTAENRAALAAFDATRGKK